MGLHELYIGFHMNLYEMHTLLFHTSLELSNCQEAFHAQSHFLHDKVIWVILVKQLQKCEYLEKCNSNKDIP